MLKEIIYDDSGEALEKIAQRTWKYPIPGKVHVWLDGPLSYLI